MHIALLFLLAYFNTALQESKHINVSGHDYIGSRNSSNSNTIFLQYIAQLNLK